MHRCCGLWLLLFLALSWSCPGWSATLRVLTGDIEPYSIGGNAERPGFAIELVQEMAKRSGYEVRIIFVPWQRALVTARHEPDTLIVPVVRTRERESLYRWIVPIVPGEAFYLIAVRPDIDISSFDAVRNIVVGGMANAPAESMLRRSGLSYLDLSTENIVSARKLLAGRFNVWFGRRIEAVRALRELGEDPQQLRFGLRVDSPDTYLAASPEFSPMIAERLAEALDTMKADGSYERIIDAYDYGWLLNDGEQDP